MTRAEYQAYLASREWAVRREQVRLRSDGRCERCREAPYEQTHHLTYANIGHEPLEDLLGVCAPCHLYLSGKSEEDPLNGRLAGPVPDQDCYVLYCAICGDRYHKAHAALGNNKDNTIIQLVSAACGHFWILFWSWFKGRVYLEVIDRGYRPEGMKMALYHGPTLTIASGS